jgi:hypothetical protein
VASPDAVIQGLSQACKDRLIGIGRGTSPEKLQSRRCGEYVALDRSEEGVWVIPPFTEQAPETGKGGGTTQPGGGALPPLVPGSTKVPDGAPGGTIAGPTGEKAAKVITAINISGKVPLESWVDLFRCFVGPARQLGLKKLELGIDFKLVAHDNQPLDGDSQTLKSMREAAKQLGLQIAEEG